jgi:hypothetical protein
MRQTAGEGAGNMKKRIIVALMITLLPATAYSQKGSQQAQPSPFERTAAQKKKDAEVEKAYQESLKANKAQTSPAKIDPWQSVRPGNANNAQQ